MLFAVDHQPYNIMMLFIEPSEDGDTFSFFLFRSFFLTNTVLRVCCFIVYSALYLSSLYATPSSLFCSATALPRYPIIICLASTHKTITTRCHPVVEQHGPIAVLSSLTASTLVPGHPSQQGRKKEREREGPRRPHPSLHPAVPRCAGSTIFSAVSTPRPPLTPRPKAKLRKQRRVQPLPIARDASARVRRLLLSFVS
jgi:hypothetical protein